MVREGKQQSPVKVEIIRKTSQKQYMCLAE